MAPRSSCAPAGSLSRPRAHVEADLPPAGHLPYGQPQRRPGLADEGEVTVVADGCHRRADGGVDAPAGLPGRSQRNRDGLGQQRADRHAVGLAGRGRVHCDQLRVSPEPAAGHVDVGQVGPEQPASGRQLVRIGDDEPDLGAERRPVGVCFQPGVGAGGSDGHHEPPEVALLVPELEVGAVADEPDVVEPELLVEPELSVEPELVARGAPRSGRRAARGLVGGRAPARAGGRVRRAWQFEGDHPACRHARPGRSRQ